MGVGQRRRDRTASKKQLRGGRVRKRRVKVGDVVY